MFLDRLLGRHLSRVKRRRIVVINQRLEEVDAALEYSDDLFTRKRLLEEADNLERERRDLLSGRQ